MDLEKIVKTSFDQFEPEVNSSVWQRLEQNLSTPQAPADPSGSASIAGKTALKTIFGNTSPWIWVAGVVSTAAIITAILTTSPEKKTVLPLALPNTQENTTVDESLNNSTTEIPKNTETPSVAGQNNISGKSNSEINDPSENSTHQESQNELDSHDPNKESSGTTEKGSDNVPTLSTEKAIEQAPDNSSNANSSNTSVPAAQFEPAVIINTQVGFAPLKVVALLNKESIKGNWDFGDGETSVSANTVSHIFTSPGTYKLVCISDSKTIEKTIEVIGTVSTAFTPNGDGVNDEFYVESRQIQELSVKILDRSGRLVFEITQPEQHWDGKDKDGENLPSGTYFYNIFARSANGQINQKGTISIFR